MGWIWEVPLPCLKTMLGILKWEVLTTMFGQDKHVMWMMILGHVIVLLASTSSGCAYVHTSSSFGISGCSLFHGSFLLYAPLHSLPWNYHLSMPWSGWLEPVLSAHMCTLAHLLGSLGVLHFSRIASSFTLFCIHLHAKCEFSCPI